MLEIRTSPWQGRQSISSHISPFLPTTHDGGTPHSSSPLHWHWQFSHTWLSLASHGGHLSSHIHPDSPKVDFVQSRHSQKHGHCPLSSMVLDVPSSQVQSHWNYSKKLVSIVFSTDKLERHIKTKEHWLNKSHNILSKRHWDLREQLCLNLLLS